MTLLLMLINVNEYAGHGEYTGEQDIWNLELRDVNRQ